jgi:hypothetical protein
MLRHRIFRHLVLCSSDGHWGNYIAHVLETLLAGGLTKMLAEVQMQYCKDGPMYVLLKKHRDANSEFNIRQTGQTAAVDRGIQ